MKKRVILSCFFLLSLLSGCSGSSGGTETQAEMTRQTFKNFTLDVPGDWRKVSANNFANTLPQETTALFLKKVEGQDFIQNVNVISESINTDASSLEYAKANILLGSKALIEYRVLSQEEVTVHAVPTVLHLFRARNSATDPLRYFAQSYFSRDNLGYTVTCIAQEDNTVEQATCESIVKSFQFTQG